MTAPVEARSLSSLTTLFANPPQYPHNPTHKALEPLVLYIVRVPGSRDVFLTPLKPPTKASINAEAIQSSLYYFHVPTPEDEAVRKSFDDHRLSWGTEQGMKPDSIHRKPLASFLFPRPSSIGSLEALRESDRSFQHSISEADENTLSRSHIENVRPTRLSSHDNSSTIARKPVGPRPFNSRLTTADSGMIGRKPVGVLTPAGNARQRALSDLPPQPGSSAFSEGQRNSIDSAAPRWYPKAGSGPSPPPPPLPPRQSYSSAKQEMEKDFRITIIRRDPTSGTQWNIGSLSREQRPATTEGESLKIEITTPGYQRFARQSDFQTTNRQSFEQAIAEIQRFSISEIPPTTGETRTSRPSSSHLGPAPFTRNLTLHNRPKNLYRHQRSSSSDLSPLSPAEPSAPTSPRGHSSLTFLSPWNGICTFTTGMDGRSLKCKHRLPSHGASEQSSDTSILAAELRFNLPWSALKNRDANVSASSGFSHHQSSSSLTSLGKDAKSSLKKGVAKIRREINSTTTSTSSDMLDRRRPSQTSTSDSSTTPSESGRLDLTLGRERAGGGRKGESAKLGKLVLRDEALKMADLVVAAAMGVWWDVYDGRRQGGAPFMDCMK